MKPLSLILVLLIIVWTYIEFFSYFDFLTYGIGQYVGLGVWFILVIIGLYRLDRWWNEKKKKRN